MAKDGSSTGSLQVTGKVSALSSAPRPRGAVPAGLGVSLAPQTIQPHCRLGVLLPRPRGLTEHLNVSPDAAKVMLPVQTRMVPASPASVTPAGPDTGAARGLSGLQPPRARGWVCNHKPRLE